MRFGILGPLDIRTDDGGSVDPGGPRPRALLTLLLLAAGRTVTTGRLTEGLYGAEPPAGAANALQSQISRLRRRLGPHAPIEAVPAGYRLAVPSGAVDVHRFERLAAEGRTALAAGDPERAADRLRAALALWRGPALPDLPDAHAETARLAELRLTAVQDRVEADLALGGGAELVPELRALLTAHPLTERLYGQLMRALHAAGRPAEALTVHEEARRTLADELGADPSPELSALHLDLLRQTRPAPHRPRLPAQLTGFVGRDGELARIAALLTAPDARLVTLTGPGGAGKTRLAVEAARSHPDACLVELAPLSDGARLPYAILAALGVREGLRSTAADGLDRLRDALEERDALLVLDNCEHLVEDAARIAGLLLGHCPGVRVLATSREALGITGEVLVPVEPLPPAAAQRLFLERARAVRPDFAGHACVPDVCRALDGLPLAIELAAARLRTLEPEELAAGLDDRFRLLSRGDRTKAPRHRTLRAVVEWSWDLLDAGERELAERLTVFAGSATVRAVREVCGTPDPEELLASLVEKSFLEVTGGRYRMLETIRAFAAEHAARDLNTDGADSTDGTDGTDALRDAHAAYFLRLAERAQPGLRGGGQLPWLARLAADRADLDAALRRLARTDHAGALRLTALLSWFWRLRGLHGEQVPAARALVAAVGDVPPPGLEEEYVLCALGALSGDGADPAAEEALHARVDAVLDSLDGPLRLPYVLVLWSVVAGPRPEANARALRLAGADPWAGALLDMGLGLQARFAGRPGQAEEALTRALAGFRATGDRWGMANCLEPLAMYAHARGDDDGALALLAEGLVHVRELDAPEETADLLRSRAVVLLRRGGTAAAEADFEQAAALARRAGAGDKAAGARRGLGDAARLAGETARARALYEEALRMCAANWFSVGEVVRVLIGLGRAAAAEERVREAREWFRQAAVAAGDAASVLEPAEAAEALASVAGTPERAAVLLGAGAGLRGAPAREDPDVVRTERETRARLSPQAYADAFERGVRLRGAALGDL
ncbi:BTAD domain-containing putative transcriptional regulator [Streptomyces similanensis]|uniref:BTAD domain-containing putative transcriptional regulator n=1 Tax=Streptomyces similanensis TaxID=1274988 RepID=A0ABP9L1D0_9ACTN